MTTPADLISVAQLKTLLDRSHCRLVDCRFDLFDAAKGRRDYLSGHLPGAVHADMDKDLASEITAESGRHPLPDVEVFRSTLEAWGIGDEQHVVVYDYGNGSLAVRLWWMLSIWLGHARVSVLNGGIAAWRGAGEPLETAEPTIPGAEFTATAEPTVIATTEDIVAAIAGGTGLTLVDARDPLRFRGEKEPVDTVAGRIPGAVNLPLSRNLGADGLWLAADELAAVWAEFHDEMNAASTIVMCGSGVTACHLILSARLAGRAIPRLYVGSWSEWIRDEKRPVATGD